MPSNPNKLSQFWQELKRRKVIKVIAMYAATAFIIMEAAEIMLPRLGLPDWTVTFIIILLIVGFPITVILSWVFDVTPGGIKKTKPSKVSKDSTEKTEKRRLKISDGIIAVLIVVVCILVYPKIFKQDKYENIRDKEGRISIIILPFQNRSGNADWNNWQTGIQSVLITNLSNSEELLVRDYESTYGLLQDSEGTNYASITPTFANEISRKLESNTYLRGTIIGSGNTIRINAQLTDSNTEEIFKSFQIEGSSEDEMLIITDSLCNEIRNFLEITVIGQEVDKDFREAYTESAEAYSYYIKGMNLLLATDYESAVEPFKKALEIDPDFTIAYFYIAYASSYGGGVKNKEIQSWIQKTYDLKSNLPAIFQYWVGHWYACYISKDFSDIVRYCALLEESGSESRLLWFDLACTLYIFAGQYDKAMKAFEKVEDINSTRNDEWRYQHYYDKFARSLHKAGKHEKESEIYDVWYRLFPNKQVEIKISYRKAKCSLSLGDTINGNTHLARFVSLKQELGESSTIESSLGQLYEEMEMLEEAEIHFRNMYHQNPNSDSFVNYLVKFLLKYDINIDEAIDLNMRLAELVGSDHPAAIWNEGLIAFKQEKYDVSLALLRESKDLFNRFYLDLHQDITEVKQALAGQESE